MDASSTPNPLIINASGNAVAYEESTALAQQPNANLNSSGDMFVEVEGSPTIDAVPSEGPIDFPVFSVDGGSTSEYADDCPILPENSPESPRPKNSCSKLNSFYTNYDTVKKRKDFLEGYDKTTGIKQIILLSNRYVPIAYVTYLILAIVVTLYQLSSLGINYFQYPITSAFTDANHNTTFPAVSLCDMYPLAHDVYNPVTFDDYKMTFNRSNVSADSPQFFYSSFVLSTFPWSNNLSASIEMDSSGNKQNPFIFRCYYTHILQGETGRCDDDITLTWDPTYKCQTLRLSGKERHGTIRGVSLYIYLDNFATDKNHQTWLEPKQMFADGVYVTIDAPGAKPGLRSGNLISAGTSSVFRITQTNRVRLPKPYSDRECTDQQYLAGSNYEIYTYDGCYSVCLQSIVVANCRCLSPYFQFTDGQLKSANYEFCGNFSQPETAEDNLKKFECCEQYNSDANFGDDCDSQCLLPCQETMYETSVSSITWPHVADQMQMYRDIIHGNAIFGNKFDIYEPLLKFNIAEQLNQLPNLHLIRNNFLQIRFIIGGEKPVKWEDIIQFNWEVTIGHIGGILGLWLGLSAMSIVMIVEFSIYSCRKFINHEQLISSNVDKFPQTQSSVTHMRGTRL